MIRKVMSDRGAKSLEDLIKDAAEQDVKIHLCTMTLDVMGLSEKEMIDYPHLDFVGVGQFVDLMSRSRYSWFF
jgi:peroxiredoxin family protein